MENASKALLMAAGMLISIMIASLLVLTFSTMSEYTKSYDEIRNTQELQAFNAQFEKYLQYKSDGTQVGLTAQDIVTIINIANEYNQKNGYNSGNDEYINVTAKNASGSDIITETSIEDNKNLFLKDHAVGVDASDNKIKPIKYIIENEQFGTANSGKINAVTLREDGFFN